MSDLPPGWTQVRLADVASTQLGRMLSARRETGAYARPYLRNRDVQWGHINVSDLPTMDFRPEDADRFRLSSGDVLVCEGGEVGRAAIWKNQIVECYFQKAIHRVRTSEALSPEFLRYLLEHYARSKAFARFTSGSTIAHLPQEDLRNLPVNLPPRGEQERIVAAIEEQFSRLDAGAAALERVRLNLRRMRAAVLQAAVTGQLVPRDPNDEPTRRWLEAHGKNADDKAVGLLPGWARTTIGELKTWSLYGPRFTSDDYVDSGVPVLRTTDITRNGRILADQAPKLPLSEADLKKYRVMAGDILVTRTGSIGTVAFIRDDAPAIPGAYLILYRFGLPIDFSEFLFLLFQAPSIQLQLVGKSAGIGRPNLNAPSIDATVVDVPPFAELVRIVDEVKRVLSSIDTMEAELVVADARRQHLRSSILATAFSGKLVPQDPDDEPASTLLERVAAERASSNGQKPIRTRKPGTPREKVSA